MRILKHRAAQSGFTIIEVVLAMSLFLMMALLFGAVVPVALRGAQQGSNNTQAALIAQQKIDQLRTRTFSTLNNGASLQSQGIIDGINTNGTYDFSTTATDGLSSALPPGTTGTVSILADAATGTMQSGVYDVTVTIAWPNSGAPAGSFTLKGKIVNY